MKRPGMAGCLAGPTARGLAVKRVAKAGSGSNVLHSVSPSRVFLIKDSGWHRSMKNSQKNGAINHGVQGMNDDDERACGLSESDFLVERRRVLLATCAIVASGVVDGCIPCASYAGDDELRMREVKMVLRVLALRGSVPQQWTADFKTALEGYGIPAISYKPTLSDIWKEMSGRAPTTVDAVTVGDAWLERAVMEGRIQPIEDPEQYRYWDALNNRWKRLVRRDVNGRVSASGRVYAVPYRWGCTVIVFRKDRMARWSNSRISDWDDLLNPKLKNRIAFMDSPRELIGIALKTLGLSYNADVEALQACGVSQENLGMRVRRLIAQAKVISNKDHVRAYSAGDVDVIVGSSDDLIPLAQKSSNSAVVVPASGTALWADLWCVPRHAAGGAVDGEPSPLLPAWLELCVQPRRATASSGLQRGVSPLLLPNGEYKHSKIRCNPIIDSKRVDVEPIGTRELPSVDVLQKSEFLEPLDDDTVMLYQRMLHASSTGPVDDIIRNL
ncbi:hypothetical protein M9434_001499 [Picochlorum sp. BPE23]|nr:hypothetical protein M9434_001499 [Picochlorum sp. BPE23]